MNYLSPNLLNVGNALQLVQGNGWQKNPSVTDGQNVTQGASGPAVNGQCPPEENDE